MLLNIVWFLLGLAMYVTTQHRKSGNSSVWTPACHDVTPGGHAGSGVVSLHGAPLALPTLVTLAFAEFFRGCPSPIKRWGCPSLRCLCVSGL